MNNEFIEVNLPQKDVLRKEWNEIRDVGIGISYVTLKDVNSKQYDVDLSLLKYSDLKDVKSKIIEICENKNIPFKNN